MDFRPVSWLDVGVRGPPAVRDAQILRDSQPEGGVGSPGCAHPRCVGGQAERLPRDPNSAKPFRDLAIQTKTPRRLSLGVSR
jgi:hypothetical protein